MHVSSGPLVRHVDTIIVKQHKMAGHERREFENKFPPYDGEATLLSPDGQVGKVRTSNTIAEKDSCILG